MCDEAVDDCLAVLKFISDLFVIGKMLEKFHNVLLDNDDILFLNQDLNKAISHSSRGCVLEVDLEYPKELGELYNDYPLATDEIKTNCKRCLIIN